MGAPAAGAFGASTGSAFGGGGGAFGGGDASGGGGALGAANTLRPTPKHLFADKDKELQARAADAVKAQEKAQQQQHCTLQNDAAFKAMAETGV